MSSTEFASHIGIKVHRYRRYERGELQPPLSVLKAIRIITGISLDFLVAGMATGIVILTMSVPGITVGNRLRWVRELFEPFGPSFAKDMNIEGQQWERYESDVDPLPVDVAMEFAHRCRVTVDFLYSGSMTGIWDQVEYQLLQRHPELFQAGRPGGTGTPPGSDNTHRLMKREARSQAGQRLVSLSD